MELQKAEEAHRDLLLKDRDERNKIAKDLHSLRRYTSCFHVIDRVVRYKAPGGKVCANSHTVATPSDAGHRSHIQESSLDESDTGRTMPTEGRPGITAR